METAAVAVAWRLACLWVVVLVQCFRDQADSHAVMVQDTTLQEACSNDQVLREADTGEAVGAQDTGGVRSRRMRCGVGTPCLLDLVCSQEHRL